jgi:hypothetical protein
MIRALILSALSVCVFGCVSTEEKVANVNSSGIPLERIRIELDDKIDVPLAVTYNRKDREYNMKAAEILKTFLLSEKCRQNDFSDTVTCGPLLWNRISKVESFKSLKGPEMKVINMNATGKIIMGDPGGAAGLFDYLKIGMSGSGTVTIRYLNPEELAIHWAFIMFDIEDPILIVDSGKQKIMVEFSEELMVTYLDDLYGVSIKK